MLLGGFPTTPTVPPGSASFTGAGVIVDPNIPPTADTIPEIQGFALVTTDATATVNFGTGAFTARQSNFVDITDAPVAGQVDYSGTLDTSAAFSTTATASGSIAGTSISASSSDGSTGVGYIGTSPGILFGFFQDVGSGGQFNGDSLSGGFFTNPN